MRTTYSLLGLGLLIMAGLAALPNPAIPQGPIMCPTRPFGDDTNACASTAFVQDAVAAASGTLTVGSTVVVGGTSGGPLYQNAGVLGGGTRSGNTTKFGSVAGSPTSGNCATWDVNGNLADQGTPCGTGGSTAQNQTFSTPGAVSTLTLTALPLPDDAKNLIITFDGIVQHANTWTIDTGTGVITFDTTIPTSTQEVFAQWHAASFTAGVNDLGGLTGNVLCGFGLDCTSVAATISSKGSTFANVQLYGAVGNGSTDDTTAVAAAVTAARASGGPAIVYFPPTSSCYRVRSWDLSTTTALTIQGNGRTSSICVYGADSAGNWMDLLGAANFTLKDINIQNDGAGSFATVTMTIASPAVITQVGHTLIAGQPITLTTTGALPTGLVGDTTYYVINPVGNTYQLAATPGGAAINTSGSQSGTHTAWNTPIPKNVFMWSGESGVNSGIASGLTFDTITVSAFARFQIAGFTAYRGFTIRNSSFTQKYNGPVDSNPTERTSVIRLDSSNTTSGFVSTSANGTLSGAVIAWQGLIDNTDIIDYPTGNQCSGSTCGGGAAGRDYNVALSCYNCGAILRVTGGTIRCVCESALVGWENAEGWIFDGTTFIASDGNATPTVLYWVRTGGNASGTNGIGNIAFRDIFFSQLVANGMYFVSEYFGAGQALAFGNLVIANPEIGATSAGNYLVGYSASYSLAASPCGSPVTAGWVSYSSKIDAFGVDIVTCGDITFDSIVTRPGTMIYSVGTTRNGCKFRPTSAMACDLSN